MQCFSRFFKAVVSGYRWEPCCHLSRLLKLFYKPIKSEALPRDCGIVTLHEGKGNTQAVAWSSTVNRGALLKGKKKPCTICALITHASWLAELASFSNHLFSRQRKCTSVPLSGFQWSIEQTWNFHLGQRQQELHKEISGENWAWRRICKTWANFWEIMHTTPVLFCGTTFPI